MPALRRHTHWDGDCPSQPKAITPPSPPPPPPAERQPPQPNQWRHAKYMSHCIFVASVMVAIALAAAPTLMQVFKALSDTTTVFDSGGAAAVNANPSAPSALGPVPLLLPLATLFLIATLVLTFVSSCVRTSAD
jgi:hypothetical protein